MAEIIGKKLGMTQIFAEDGEAIAVTIVEALPFTVMAHLSPEVHGASLVQVASGKVKEAFVNKPEAGQFKKAGIAPAKHISTFRDKELEKWELGKEYNVSIFEGEKKVTIIGTGKGKGFAGTVKRYNFSRGPTTHGSHNIRAPGSLGAHSYPARVFPGKKLPGHMGDHRVTTKNLDVIKVDAEKNLLYVRGSVPGAINGKVIVRKQ